MSAVGMGCKWEKWWEWGQNCYAGVGTGFKSCTCGLRISFGVVTDFGINVVISCAFISASSRRYASGRTVSFKPPTLMYLLPSQVGG